MPIKLNLGAGHSVIEGFTPIDRKLGSEVYPLAYVNDFADEIRASHVLEHFPQAAILEILREWIRVLKPGGLLKIAVPDFNFAIRHREHPHFEGWVMGGQSDENDFHMTLFTRGKLLYYFQALGLEDIQDWQSEIKDCASLPVSLNLCGRKPRAAK